MRQLLGAFISLLAVATSSMAEDDDATWMQHRERLIGEARELFAVMLKPEPSGWTPAPYPAMDDPKRCTIEGEWYTYAPVPEMIARDHLGLTIHADLTISSYVASTAPREILPAAFATPDAFCTRLQQDQFLKDMQQTVLKRYAHREANEDGFDQIVAASRTGYSFPVFSGNFERAVVMVQNSHIGVRRVLRDGSVTSALSNGGAVVAELWDKKDGAWRLSDTKQVGTFH